MNTVNSDVLTYLQYIGCGTFGTDLFFGRVPNSNKVSTKLWWVVPTNLNLTKHNVSGEDSLRYQYELNYRSMSLQDVDEEMFRITKEIVGSHCYELDNFHTIEVSLVSASHRYSVDSEERVYGTVVFTVTVYNILDPKN